MPACLPARLPSPTFPLPDGLSRPSSSDRWSRVSRWKVAAGVGNSRLVQPLFRGAEGAPGLPLVQSRQAEPAVRKLRGPARVTNSELCPPPHEEGSETTHGLPSTAWTFPPQGPPHSQRVPSNLFPEIRHWVPSRHPVTWRGRGEGQGWGLGAPWEGVA